MENRARSNLFMSTTLVSLFMAAAFNFDHSGVHWFWSDRPQVAVVLVVLGTMLGAFWFNSQKRLRRG